MGSKISLAMPPRAAADGADPVHRNPNSAHRDASEPKSTDAQDLEEELGEEEDGDEDDDEEEEEDEEEDEEELHLSKEARLRSQRAKLQRLLQLLQGEKVKVRVHDVVIKGNVRTKDSIIEAELEALKDVTSMQELLKVAGIVTAHLQRLEIFDSVNITVDSGPPELPGTANVIVEVTEAKSPLTGSVGLYTKVAGKSASVEGSVTYKNMFGHGDLWDASLTYGWDRSSEVCLGVTVPRFKGLVNPVAARLHLMSQDWMKLSSYKEHSMGLSLGLVSTRYHDLSYNLAWRTLTDPSRVSSRTVRRQLGHGLLSSLKYTFKLDMRNSAIRPTRGYAFVSTTQLGGLVPDSRSIRFLRQEFDLRYAIPFGFCHAALNFGISAGVIFPWGSGYLSKPSSLPDKFFLGGNTSPVCSLGGPMSLLGFKSRGMGPTEPRRESKDQENDEDSDSYGRDALGGDLAVTAFADLSFNLPSKWLSKKGIHGHVFACAGNLAKLTENEFQKFSFQNFSQSFRSSVGAGLVVPMDAFRLELNYCHITKQFDYDHGKTGFQCSFTFPSS